MAESLTDFLLARIAEDEAHTGDLSRGWSSWVQDECEAKRRIIAEHTHTTDVISAGYTGPNLGLGCEVCHDWDGVTEGLGWCVTLRALTLPNADHPDYDESWRP